mgnify:CR=1 FL=1
MNSKACASRLKQLLFGSALAVMMLVPAQHAEACTRVVYETGTGTYITARGMDWNSPDAPTALWVYPRGMEQNGGIGKNPIKWTSKYGSVFASFYPANADGMNEKGLVANVLYLAEADFGDAAETGKPTLSIGAWNQYFLDNYATVAEAVAAMQDPPFAIIAPTLPNGRAAAVHLSISDASGDSAIFEYIDGQLQIHHSRDYSVMTNSPPFDEQLALINYWRHIGGDRFLPGTIEASDRFVRTDYMLRSTPKFKDTDLAVGAAFSVIRTAGVPLGMQDPDRPNIAMTLWRTVADHANLTYYFESVLNPSVLWVDLNNIDFGEGSGARTIALGRESRLAGEVSAEFEPAEPFEWISGE